MKKVKIPSKSVDKTVYALKRGGVVIFPTDTVYGFLADASNKKAVEKVFNIKKRPKSKPLPVFVKDIKMARDIAVVDDERLKVLKKYWPGNHTFVLKKKKVKLYGTNKNSIALRVPRYKPLNNVLKKINRPLAQTSVNISGTKPLNNIIDIIREFSDEKNVALIISGGNLRRPKPSKIIDLSKSKAKILRK